MSRPRARALTLFISMLVAVAGSHARAQDARVDGTTIYRAACAACHGVDGKGLARDLLGSAWPVPDLTSCSFATPERTDDWRAIVRGGGTVRGFRHDMPAFGDALTDTEIDAAISHVRSFCAAPRWPAGDLNFPRPLMTEKAFPENEAVLTASLPVRDRDNGEIRLLYERRIGPRGQFEAAVPFVARELGAEWHRGIGDVSFGYKHLALARQGSGALVSGAATLTVPTGYERYGLGFRLVTLETSVLAGQRLRRHLFAHGQAGFAFPLNIASTPNEVFWRAAIGADVNAGQPGRAWAPMLEVTGHRELEFGDPVRWDLVPQLQATLSRRQHVRASAGVRLPVGGPSRPASAMVSLAWDWFEGGPFEGW